MAQSGDGVAANDSGSNLTNLLTSPAQEVFLINRGAQEVFIRVVWHKEGIGEHTSGHTGSNYATMRTNEPRSFGKPGSQKIVEVYVHTATGNSTVDWHVKSV